MNTIQNKIESLINSSNLNNYTCNEFTSRDKVDSIINENKNKKLTEEERTEKVKNFKFIIFYYD